jgi:hypothetical protein
MSSEFGESKMNNEKFDFENLVGVALRGHPSRKPTEGLPYITPNYELRTTNYLAENNLCRFSNIE